MHLVLKWMSNSKKQYDLGILSKEKDKYIFEINEDELKKAINDGCMGIGNFSLLNKREESKELFSFFKHRIVNENSWKVKELLEKYKLNQYDDMKILAITKGRSINDRYWVEEVL